MVFLDNPLRQKARFADYESPQEATSFDRNKTKLPKFSSAGWVCMICTILSLLSLFSTAMAEARERTFIMVKPDGVQRGLVGKIIKRFEQKGFKLVALKFVWVSMHSLTFHVHPV